MCRRLSLPLVRALLLLGALWTLPTAAQPSPERAGYLLANRFGDLCPVCEAVVVCGADGVPEGSTLEQATGSGVATVYYFRSMGFWDQVATVWYWFLRISGGDPSHGKPVNVLEFRDGEVTDRRVLRATLSMEPPVIELGPRRIERVGGVWRQEQRDIGRCSRLPLRPSLPALESHMIDSEGE